MNEPFEFLDEDEETEEEEKGLAWLPLTLAGIALAGFLSIPLLGLLKPGKPAADWSDFANSDAIEVKVDSEAQQEPILTPSPEDLTEELQSVDETLSALGSGGRTTLLSANEKPKTTASKTITRLVPVKKPTNTSVASQSDRLTKTITIKPGDTLYGIARQTGSTPEEIATINGMKKNDPIHAGKVLKVPSNGETVAQKPTRTNTRVTRPTAPTNQAQVAQRQPAPPTGVRPQPRAPQPVQPIVTASPQAPVRSPQTVNPSLFPYGEPSAQRKEQNPLDKYNHAIAYRVQNFDNINRIADAHATSPAELIELNGRADVRKGEMLVVPVDNCLIKNE